MAARGSAEFDAVFQRLKAILKNHAGGLMVTDDKPGRYGLEGKVGPATLQAWGGKARKPTIQVAWIEIGKSYVSYHLMSMYGNTALQDSMSPKLKARMQGKTCFNFKTGDEALFAELEEVTMKGLAAFRRAGFVDV